jgi:peptide/nickel transport system substrate-binding protein
MDTETRRRRSRRSLTVGAAVVMGLALVAGACGGTSNNAGGSNGSTPGGTNPNRNNPLEAEETPTPGGKLVVAVPAETNGWNPAKSQWADAGSNVGSSFLETLSVLDSEGKALPWLADSWKSNADFTQWDISVKPNIKYHNGQPLDGKSLAENLTFIYQNGLTKIALESQYDHVEQTGPLSAKVYLKRPWSQWPVSLQNVWMMAPEMLATPDNGVAKPIGTGPFIFQEWQTDKYLRAKKNPTYWRKGPKGEQLPLLDEIEFRPLVDDDSKDRALSAKDVDVALTTSAQLAKRLQDDGFSVIRDYTSERTFIMLNTAEGPSNAPNPFTNIHARKALAYGTDRAYIAGLVGEGVETATQGYRPESPWGMPESETGYPAFDLKKAKEEVEAYKKDTGRSSLSFTLTGLTTLEDQTIMQALEGQWKEAGIETKINAQEQVKYISTIAVGNYQAGWFRWYGYLNPDSNYVYNAKEDANPIGQLSINFTHYTSDKMQQNLEAIRKTDDLEARKKANVAVVKETNEQAINIWLFDTPYAYIAAQRVKGMNEFRTHPFGNFSPKPWWASVWIQK